MAIGKHTNLENIYIYIAPTMFHSTKVGYIFVLGQLMFPKTIVCFQN